jgi:cytochrome c-type biogenesis protein CcmH/NrfG
MISLGAYPDVSLSMARERRDAAPREVANNVDPSVKRRADQAAAEAAAHNTFELVARSYLASIAFLVRKWKRSIRTY